MKKELRRHSDWPFPAATATEMAQANYDVREYIDEAYPSLDFVTTSHVNPVGNLQYTAGGSTQNASIGGINKYTPEVLKALVLPDIGEEYDPRGGSLNEPGKKADARKNRPWLFFSGFARALEETAKVTTLGAEKYTPGGWATVPDGINRYMEAAMRHMIALGKGKVLDDGIGGLGVTYHKAQVAWNILASLELELQAREIAKESNASTTV